MLSYRHAFHAGNYADVLKHLVLCRILAYLIQKPGAIRYIDTHAGAGGYSLRSPEALKTAEFASGIGLLWDRQDLPVALKAYRDLIEQFNANKVLNTYPGSPWLAQQLLREQDHLDLCELHPQDIDQLMQRFQKDKRIHCYYDDGFACSLALLPPVEKRGLIVIDPSYELKEDYSKVVSHIQALYKRFATGVYALWYPVVESHRVKKLEAAFRNSGIKRIHLYEISITSNHNIKGMTGCGMIVINPPWMLKEEITQALDYFSSLISDTGKAIYRVVEIAGE
ncbi:MAG: 23S rRNA (adenine(2030)-N(6))-methyltransferase RlmJ [Gammaproteobacteria bacterium]|nr:23S rRNA (adenine(2030)-N(6))-methyltransferase RlmJ [Gammaproteobacteria bacterium]